MPSANPAVLNFNGGEVGALLSGRTDYEKYSSTSYRMRRFIPTAQGPAKRTPGTVFVLPTRYADSKVWLHRFEFAFDQAYILEFGDQYVRFYTDRGVVLEDSIDVAGISNATTGVLIYSGADPSNGDWFYVEGVLGMTGVNGRYVQVSNVNTGAKTFEMLDTDGFPIDTTSSGTYNGNGDISRVYTIASPYAEADLFTAEGTPALSISQSGDVLYIGCEGYQPRTLSRAGNTSWSFALYAPNDGPFQREPLTPDTITLSADTGNVTVTSTTALFDANSVGMLIRVQPINITTTQWETGKSITAGEIRKSNNKFYEAMNTATTGAVRPIHEEGQDYDGNTGVLWKFLHPGYVVLKITAFTSTTSVDADVIGPGIAPAELLSGASSFYRLGAWGTGMGGAYPYKTAFWRGRLWWAGGQNIYGSVSGDYASMAPDTMGEILADNSLNLTIAIGNVDKVRWLKAGNALLVGTGGSEIAIREAVSSQALGPENIKFDLQSAEGSREVDPVLVEDSALFVRIGGRRIMELRYDIQTEAYVPRDMNVLYPEITKSGIVDIAYQKEPDDIIWCVLADGRLIGLTYDREQNVYGWHQQPIAGPSAKVESVQVISGPNGDVDDVWMVVARSLEGNADNLILSEDSEAITAEDGGRILTEISTTQTKRYIEYFAQSLEDGDDIQGSIYLDSSLQYDPSVNEILTAGPSSATVGATNVSFSVETFFELATEDDEILQTEAGDELVTNDPIFVVSDVGREIRARYYDEDMETWRTARALITSYVSETEVLATIISEFPSTTIEAGSWRMTTTTLSGLWHLEGETVSALADGAEVQNLTVTDGSVTLPYAAARAIVGLPYTSILATQRIDAGAAIGTAQAKTKRMQKLVLRLYASLGGKFGPSQAGVDEIIYRRGNDLLDEVPPTLTGDTDSLAFPGGYETDGRIWILADQPLPMTVVALYPELETSG